MLKQLLQKFIEDNPEDKLCETIKAWILGLETDDELTTETVYTHLKTVSEYYKDRFSQEEIIAHNILLTNIVNHCKPQPTYPV